MGGEPTQRLLQARLYDFTRPSRVQRVDAYRRHGPPRLQASPNAPRGVALDGLQWPAASDLGSAMSVFTVYFKK